MSSTAKNLEDLAFEFAGRRITIKALPGVVGNSYYTDYGLQFLPAIAKDISSFIDAGCGRGTYTVALASLPHVQVGYAFDINPHAIGLVARNLDENKITKNIHLFAQDAAEFFKDAYQVELIVADMPMIPIPKDFAIDQEMRIICDGGASGMHYVQLIIESSSRYLITGGKVFFVQPDFYINRTKALMQKNGLQFTMLGTQNKYLHTTQLTNALRSYIEQSCDYQFQTNSNGTYFNLCAVLGTQK